MICSKLPSEYWRLLKEEGSEIVCSTCKQVLIYNPNNYSEQLIKSIIEQHKGTHFANELEAKAPIEEDDIVF